MVGDDLNLEYQGNPNVQDCVPAGWSRKGDVQHIMATADFTFDFSQALSMDGTDHDGWLVSVLVP